MSVLINIKTNVATKQALYLYITKILIMFMCVYIYIYIHKEEGIYKKDPKQDCNCI